MLNLGNGASPSVSPTEPVRPAVGSALRSPFRQAVRAALPPAAALCAVPLLSYLLFLNGFVGTFIPQVLPNCQ